MNCEFGEVLDCKTQRNWAPRNHDLGSKVGGSKLYANSFSPYSLMSPSHTIIPNLIHHHKVWHGGPPSLSATGMLHYIHCWWERQSREEVKAKSEVTIFLLFTLLLLLTREAVDNKLVTLFALLLFDGFVLIFLLLLTGCGVRREYAVDRVEE